MDEPKRSLALAELVKSRYENFETYLKDNVYDTLLLSGINIPADKQPYSSDDLGELYEIEQLIYLLATKIAYKVTNPNNEAHITKRLYEAEVVSQSIYTYVYELSNTFLSEEETVRLIYLIGKHHDCDGDSGLWRSNFRKVVIKGMTLPTVFNDTHVNGFLRYGADIDELDVYSAVLEKSKTHLTTKFDLVTDMIASYIVDDRCEVGYLKQDSIDEIVERLLEIHNKIEDKLKEK
jgi:hypothetical protein